MISPNVWSTDENSPDHEKSTRIQSRGTFVSVLSALLLTIVGAIMASMNVSDNNIEILFGFLFAPVLGYILDTGLGTDEGLRVFKKNPIKGIFYMMDSLVSSKFYRFIITFLLDLFISKPLSSVIKGYLLSEYQNINLSKSKTGIEETIRVVDKTILDNLPSFIQSIVGFLTFQAYTNQTRFLWAYPDPDLPLDERIKGSTIMMSVAIAGIFYLVSYQDEVKALKSNIFYVLLALLILTALSFTDTLDAEKVSVDELDTEPDTFVNKYKTIIGTIIFLLFTFIGVVYPLFSAQGKSKRQGITDPIVKNIIKKLKKTS
jgi:hypothetical protein